MLALECDGFEPTRALPPAAGLLRKPRSLPRPPLPCHWQLRIATEEVAPDLSEVLPAIPDEYGDFKLLTHLESLERTSTLKVFS